MAVKKTATLTVKSHPKDGTVVSSLFQMLQKNSPTLLDREDGHWYRTRFGSVYPSISTVLAATRPKEDREGLKYWKETEPAHRYILERAQDTGTQSHRIIENYFGLTDSKANSKMEQPYKDIEGYLDGCFSDGQFDLLPLAHFKNLIPLLKKISGVVCTEQRMYSDKLRVAGTADLIGMYDGVLSVIDYKTKRRPQQDSYMYEYYLQTTCYARMFEEMTGQKIRQLVILVSSENNTRQEFVRQCDEYEDAVAERIEQFYIESS